MIEFGERIRGIEKAFRNLATNSPINRESVVQGWELFSILAAIRAERVMGTHQINFGDPNITAVQAALAGSRMVDRTDTSLGHFIFRIATRGVDEKPGLLLRGIEGADLEKATAFCRAMDEVGWEPGDLDRKYPITAA